MHDPSKRPERLAAASRGGKHTKATQRLPNISVASPDDIVTLLVATINRINAVDKNGHMSIKTANCIAHLSAKILEAMRLRRGIVEEPFEVLEAVRLGDSLNAAVPIDGIDAPKKVIMSKIAQAMNGDVDAATWLFEASENDKRIEAALFGANA